MDSAPHLVRVAPGLVVNLAWMTQAVRHADGRISLAFVQGEPLELAGAAAATLRAHIDMLAVDLTPSDPDADDGPEGGVR